MKIAMYGIGKMGISLAAAFLDKGYEVIGADINKELVDSINQGSFSTSEPEVTEIIKDKKEKFKATTDLIETVKQATFHIIFVPLIVTDDKKPDLSIVLSVCDSISQGLKKGDIVTVETTLPPNSSKKEVIPALEKSGLKAGVDFYYAMTPERGTSGRLLRDFKSYKKIVGGINIESTEKVSEIYKNVFEQDIVKMSSPSAAEAVKVFEMVYRDTKIAFANEMALMCEKLGLDFWEVKQAANTDVDIPANKINTEILNAGAGVGGHCIPVYPYFLYDLEPKIIKTAREINESMPRHMIELLESTDVKSDSKICVLGLAYAPYAKETRFSPTFDIVKLLKEKYNNVSCYDPLYSADEIKNILDIKGYDSFANALESDFFLIITAHKEFKDLEIQKDKTVIDGRHLLDPKKLDKTLVFRAVGFR